MQVLERKHDARVDPRDGVLRQEYEYKRHGTKIAEHEGGPIVSTIQSFDELSAGMHVASAVDQIVALSISDE